MTHAEFTACLSPKDFVALHFEFLPAGEWRKYEGMIGAALDGSSTLSAEDWQKTARDLALATWAARFALHQYLTDKVAPEEWTRLLQMVHPETALLLQRLKRLSQAKTLDEAFSHEHATFVLFDDMQQEVGLARAELRLDFWQQMQDELSDQVSAAQDMLQQQRRSLKKYAEQVLHEPERENEILKHVKEREKMLIYGGALN